MGRMQQRKGRTAEREVAAILQAHGLPAQPGDPMNFGTQPDIVGTPWHPEVKRAERWQLHEWLAQATRDAQVMGDGPPVVIFRSNRQPWRVCLTLEDFLLLTTSQNLHKTSHPQGGKEG